MFYLSIHLSIYLSIYPSIDPSIYLSIYCHVLSCPVLPYPSKIYTIYNYIYLYIYIFIFILCTTFIHLNVHWMFIPYSWGRGFNPSICSHLSRSSSTPTSIGPPNITQWCQLVVWRGSPPAKCHMEIGKSTIFVRNHGLDFKYLNVMLVYWRPAS